MKTKYLFLVCIAGAIISLDQMTKMLILANFHLGESHEIIPGFFNLTYVRNPGAAFGFLADAHPSFREIFFLSIPPAAALFIIWILRSIPDDDYIQIIAFSLIFSGALGNYIDRLRFRYVVDFLDFHYKSYTWPAFNVADSSIVCGVVILSLLFIRDAKKSSTQKA